MKKLAACIAAVLALLLVTGGAVSQEKYPTKPIRLVVPFPPGGGTDLMARAIAQKLTESFGVSVVVDNRPGAGGTIGAETVVRAAPDGYTMIVVSGSYATNAALYKLAYDPVNDIAPITLLGEAPFLLSFHPSVPIKSVKELVVYDKANPGKLNYGSTGTGGITHLASELFNQLAGTKLTHVPYKGTGPAVNDLMGGQVQLMFGAMPALLPQVKTNRLRGIAVTTARRSAAAPEIPTIAETVPGYESASLYAAWGPKALPAAIVARWNQEINRILQLPDVKERMASEGVELAGGSPARFREVLKRDVPKWQKVVKAGNIKAGS